MTLAQVFSCEFCEIFKNTFFIEHIQATASNKDLKARDISNLPRDIEILGWCLARQPYLMGDGSSLALVGHPSSDAITIKINFGVDVLYIDQPRTPSFFYWVG